jgi:hypothetical protein
MRRKLYWVLTSSRTIRQMRSDVNSDGANHVDCTEPIYVRKENWFDDNAYPNARDAGTPRAGREMRDRSRGGNSVFLRGT